MSDNETKQREQRRALLLALTRAERNRLRKAEAIKILGINPTTLDGWLTTNDDLLLYEHQGCVCLGHRPGSRPLLRNPDTNGIGGSWAVKV